MKTALQEFIDNVIPMHIIELDMIKQEINKALEKEKEQIMNAYNHNMTGFDKLEQEEIGLNWAEDYYNQTYNQNK
jgi:hypothetical protein